MNHSKKLRTLLVVGGLLAAAIGAALVFTPAQFHASNGINIGPDASLRSEMRAPGGVLLATGLLMLLGALRRTHASLASGAGAVVFLAYGGARLVGMACDGMPGPGLVAATAVELLLGTAFAIARLRAGRGTPITEGS